MVSHRLGSKTPKNGDVVTGRPGLLTSLPLHSPLVSPPTKAMRTRPSGQGFAVEFSPWLWRRYQESVRGRDTRVLDWRPQPRKEREMSLGLSSGFLSHLWCDPEPALRHSIFLPQSRVDHHERELAPKGTPRALSPGDPRLTIGFLVCARPRGERPRNPMVNHMSHHELGPHQKLYHLTTFGTQLT